MGKEGKHKKGENEKSGKDGKAEDGMQANDEKEKWKDESTEHSMQAKGEKEKYAKEGNLEKKCKEYENDLKRIAAEFDNYKKRVEKEKQMARQIGKEDVLLQLLVLRDEFDSALLHKKDDDGMKLLSKKLNSIISSSGVREIPCSGNINPHFHEVMMQVPGGNEEEIAKVLRKGYLVGERLLRPAQVSVYSGKKENVDEKKNEAK
ncbi:MAG: nucleotide exchange factor GrpE [Candidatus Micrarchaeota archaeon]